jgi:hypothetical protein
MSKVIDADHGYNRIVKTLLKELDGIRIQAGVQADAGNAKKRGKGGKVVKSDTHLLLIATVHEYGLNGMPQRSFIRGAYDDNKQLIEKLTTALASGAITSKMPLNAALNQVGNAIEGMIKNKIRDGPFKPNSPATIKRKGSSRPLIDTGHLRQSIRYKVLRKGEDDG